MSKKPPIKDIDLKGIDIFKGNVQDPDSGSGNVVVSVDDTNAQEGPKVQTPQNVVETPKSQEQVQSNPQVQSQAPEVVVEVTSSEPSEREILEKAAQVILSERTGGKVKSFDELDQLVLGTPNTAFANEQIEMINNAVMASNGQVDIGSAIQLYQFDPEKASPQDVIILEHALKNPDLSREDIQALVEGELTVDDGASEKVKKHIEAKVKARYLEAKKYVSEYKQKVFSKPAARSSEAMKKQQEELQKAIEVWENDRTSAVDRVKDVAVIFKSKDKTASFKYQFTEEDKAFVNDALSFTNMSNFSGPFWDMYKTQDGQFDFDRFARDIVLLKNKDKIFLSMAKESQGEAIRSFVDQYGKNVTIGVSEKASSNKGGRSLADIGLDLLNGKI